MNRRLAGRLVGMVVTLFGGIFLEEMSVWVWLAVSMPINSISGGASTFVLITYSFASDNSQPRYTFTKTSYLSNVWILIFRDRYFRIAIVGYMWEVAAFVGVPLGAWLFNTGSYLLVFGTGVTIYLAACILGLNTLWGFKEKLNKDQKNLPLAGSQKYSFVKRFF